MSLPQGADRSEAEYARFKQGLATMAACAAPRAPAPAPLLTPRASHRSFYLHPFTHVLWVQDGTAGAK